MSASLRLRLALTHAGVAIVAIAVVAAIVNLAGQRRFDSYLVSVRADRMQALVQSVHDTYDAKIGGWDAHAVLTVGQVAAANAMQVTVIDLKGMTLFTAGSHGGMVMPGGMMDGNMTDGSPSASANYVVQRFSVDVAGKQVATAVVFGAKGDVSPANSAYRHAVNTYLLLAALIAGLTAIAVGIVATRRITGPLEDLTHAAGEMAGGQRTVRVSVEGSDEIATLGAAFNGMAEAIDRQEEWRRTMTADLAHELRTPLATIQSRAEALEDGMMPATPENLHIISAEVDRLARLLAALRSLDETDSDAFDVERLPLDLGAIADDAAEVMREAFAAKGVGLVVDAQAVTVAGDRDRLRQIAANLLDNALKFTPAGGHVRITTGAGGEPAADLGSPIDVHHHPDRWAWLRVGDDGPGIKTTDLPYVFERLYRARSAHGVTGAGLGLAIVKRLVEAHAGVVEAQSEVGEGATFTVWLPEAH